MSAGTYHTVFRPGHKPKFSFPEIEAMARVLLQAGMHPAKARERLSGQGIHWEYQFTGQGLRERRRRLKRMGLELCSCGGTKPLGRTTKCDDCLAKKWSDTQ